ncbi:putative rRNA methylase [Elusimicrobium minutum Pei191]|uniref:Putative rRNA methylase n=1 Tax=Elusimicrobium minutum (strain Pei191) TaxID=445932 RepID=B2KAR0_ELUMP|nr:TlyA family RNA methyltransferase [Elusimicrobium minutum]ACC97606.1 putative rRNA methylase [Elusimicrobium minutum Pei191]
MMTSNPKKPRLDMELIAQGFFKSRTRAQASIMAGEVLVNGTVEYGADRKIKPEDIITLKEKSCPYVSRGGLKLEHALKEFKIEVNGKICADIGVATGGFSHCFLKLGAKKVYGVDVGKGQLASEVAAYKNFIFKNETNARFMSADMFDDKFEVAAVDVSFISLKMILEPLLKCMSAEAHLAVLIKPQFELTPKQVPGGIVKTEENRQLAIKSVRDFFNENLAKKYNAQSLDLIESPIKGTHGNIEYLWHIKKTPGPSF